MTQKELDEMIAAEAERLNLGSEEFMRRHNEIMEEADRIQKREAERKEKRKNMEELGEALAHLGIHGDPEIRVYEHIIIVYLDQEYLGVYSTKAKGFIDLDTSRVGKGRSEKYDESGDCEPVYGTGTETDGGPSAEQHGQQSGAGSGGTDYSAGDGSAGDGHETAGRGREEDPGDADDQGGSRPHGVII